MFKKTKVRSILELLGKDLSGREMSKILGISRNTVAEVQVLYEASGKNQQSLLDSILLMNGTKDLEVVLRQIL